MFVRPLQLHSIDRVEGYRNAMILHSIRVTRHFRIRRVKLPQLMKITSTSCSSTLVVSQDLNKAGVVVAVNYI